METRSYRNRLPWLVGLVVAPASLGFAAWLQQSGAQAPSRWDPAISARYQRVSADSARERGCLACHTGIEVINERMQPILLAYAEGREGYECAVCHEGHPGAATREEAHAGMIPNPSNMWALSQGRGCAKCHSNSGAITTVMGRPLDQPTGGSLMAWVSTRSDPTGATGANHVYRLERALMALETGKANKILMSNGVIPKGEWRYANFDMDDPDGPVPSAGSEVYRTWIATALRRGHIQRLERVQAIPNLEEGTRLWGEVNAGFADMHRKQCGRCHVWGEGRARRGDHRGGGCAACHVLYTNDALYEGGDPTIPRDRGPHLMRHRITTNVPAAQCTHCHTRGKRIGTSFQGIIEHSYVGSGSVGPLDSAGHPQEAVYTKEYNPVRGDLHGERGMSCADCHSSIDVHGDGNIYPVTFYQVEVACADCHGTPQQYPWDLPIGYGTPVELRGPRGTASVGGAEYLLTNRGNPRARWVREGTRAFVVNPEDSSRRDIPLLRNAALHNSWRSDQGRVAMAVVSQHMDRLECYACHSTWAPQCYGCHIRYDARRTGTDWVLSALNHDSTGRQTITQALGDIALENVGQIRWEYPILARNFRGRVAPVVPGCQVVWSYVDRNGVLRASNVINTTSTGHRAPTLAPVQPHTTTIPARTCESCHTDPKALGYGTGNGRSAPQLLDDRPLFNNQGPGVFGDIPTSSHARPQIPGIPGFPFAWDQLVTRRGEQVQNMPLLADSPLTMEQRGRVEREGLCVACHRYYNTATWATVRERLRGQLSAEGRALTAEQHDRAVAAALRALAGVR